MSKATPIILLGMGAAITGLALARSRTPTPATKKRVRMDPRNATMTPEYQKSTVAGSGMVLGLTNAQIVTRALYLAGEKTLDELDEYIHHSPLALKAFGYQTEKDRVLSIFYQLDWPMNGGRNPRNPDPGARWILRGGSGFVNRTADCTGGVSWMIGIDRIQKATLSKFWGGEINVDARIAAAKAGVGWKLLDQPIPGCVIGCESGSVGHERYGHEGVVIEVPAVWDPSSPVSWEGLKVVNCAALGSDRCNVRTTARGWMAPWVNGKRTHFMDTILTPTL